MSESVTLRVTRALHMAGERVEAGTTLKLSPMAAADVLASGRAELLHKADTEACRKAVREDVARSLKAAGGPMPKPPEGWPWVPHI